MGRGVLVRVGVGVDVGVMVGGSVGVAVAVAVGVATGHGVIGLRTMTGVFRSISAGLSSF